MFFCFIELIKLVAKKSKVLGTSTICGENALQCADVLPNKLLFKNTCKYRYASHKCLICFNVCTLINNCFLPH